MPVRPQQRSALRRANTKSAKGPTGTIEQGSATFDVQNGVISFGGAPFGRVDDHGAFDVQIRGRRFIGNLAELMGAVINASLSNGTRCSNAVSGTVQIGQTSFVVRRGLVFQNDQVVGTVDDKGRYNVSLDGLQATGLLDVVDGVALESTLDNRSDWETEGATQRSNVAELTHASFNLMFGDARTVQTMVRRQ